MTFDLARFIDAVVTTVRDHADYLTQLDQAIGDGDHGINMKRGFDAVADLRAELTPLPPGAALAKVGTTLVMKIGGASGPLYGSLFMALGKALPDPPTPADLVTAFAAGIAAVKARGKSDVGAKTMLDVLVPAHSAWQQAIVNGSDPAAQRQAVLAQAARALDATIPMQASKGRAAFLGARSVGHPDPGAASSFLLIKAICATFEEVA